MMDCRSFLEQLDAFADGECDASNEAALDEHARRCSACRARTEEIHALHRSVARVYEGFGASEGLRDSIRAALRDHAVHAAPVATLRASKPAGLEAVAPPRPASPAYAMGSSVEADGEDVERLERVRKDVVRKLRIFVPVGLAAAVALAVFLWQVTSVPAVAGPAVIYVDNPVLKAAQATHWRCSRYESLSHAQPGLPRGLEGLSSALSEVVGLDVLAPNLTSEGFDLVGGRRCRVADVPVAHVLYYAPRTDATLSLFTLYRVPDLLEGREGSERRYFVTSTGAAPAIAWHDQRQTYVVCASLAQHDLVGFAERIRDEAVALRPSAVRAVLAAVK